MKQMFKWKDFMDIMVGVVIALMIVTTIGRATVVGESMENTYQDGNTVILDKQLYKVFGIDRGDIAITTELEGMGRHLVKRVIGIPGDNVKIENNKVYINNKELKEEYIKEDMVTNDLEVDLSEDEYFLMGDNRNDSIDSRAIGVIRKSEIYGVSLFKINTHLDTSKLR